MRRQSVCVLVLSCLLCLLALGSAADSFAGVSRPELNVLAGINSARSAHGLRPLRYSSSLDRSSRSYAHAMVARHYFGHMPNLRISARFRTRGEVLDLQRGWHPRARSVVSDWLHSSAHRSLILSPGFRYMGAGTVRGHFGTRNRVWVVHLGRL